MNTGFGSGDFTYTATGSNFTGAGSDDSNSGHGDSASTGQDILHNFPYLRQGLGQNIFSQPVSTINSQQQNFSTLKGSFIENFIQTHTNSPYFSMQSQMTQGQVPSISTFTSPLSQLQNQITQSYSSQIGQLPSIQSTSHPPTVTVQDASCQPFYVPVSLTPCHGGTLSSSSQGQAIQGTVSSNSLPTSLSTPIFTTVKSEDNLIPTLNTVVPDSSIVIENSTYNFSSSATSVDTNQQHLLSTPVVESTNTLDQIIERAKTGELPADAEIQSPIKSELLLVETNNVGQSVIKINEIGDKEENQNSFSVYSNDFSVLNTDNESQPVRFVLKGGLHHGSNVYPLAVLTEPVDREDVFFENLAYNLFENKNKANVSEKCKSNTTNSSRTPSQEREKAHYSEPSIAEIRAGVVVARDESANTDNNKEEDSDSKTDDYDAEESFTHDNSSFVSQNTSMNENWYNVAMQYSDIDVGKGEDFDDIEIAPSIKKGGRSDPENPFAITSPSFSESAAKALMTTTNSSTATIVMMSIMSIGSRKKLIPKIISSKAAEGGIVSIVNPVESKTNNVEVKSETTPIMSKIRREKKDESNETDENDTEIDRLDINIKIDDDQYVCHGEHKRWQCKLCPKSYTTKHNLVAHILDHSCIKPHLCLVCGKYFKQLSHLNTHMLTHDNVKPHVCSICHKGFTQISHLKRHETVHLASKPYICDICNRGFAYPSELRIHKDKHIPGKEEKCVQCNLEFATMKEADKHIPGKEEKCVQCELEFATMKELKEHLLLDKRCNDHTCRHCERVFKFPSQLRDHMLSHAGSRPFICSECGMDFIKEHHLKAHQFTHTGLRPYTCPHCNRAFNQKANMMRHMLIHNAERAFKCQVCSKTFTQPQTLKAHMVVHADRKPYSCKFCGKQFGRQHNLQGHLHIHSDSKPYVCSICQSAFTLKGNLNRHKKVKHGLNESTENMEEDAVNFLSSLSGRATDSLIDTDQEFDEMTSSDSRSPKKGRKSVPRKHVIHDLFDDNETSLKDDEDVSDDEESRNVISYSDEERENEVRMKGERSKYFVPSDSENSKSKHKQNNSLHVGNNDEDDDDINETYYDDVDKNDGNGLDDDDDEEVIIKDENENGVRKTMSGKGKKETLEPERRSTRKRKQKDIMFDYDVGDDEEEIKGKRKPARGSRKGVKLDNLIANKFKNL